MTISAVNQTTVSAPRWGVQGSELTVYCALLGPGDTYYHLHIRLTEGSAFKKGMSDAEVRKLIDIYQIGCKCAQVSSHEGKMDITPKETKIFVPGQPNPVISKIYNNSVHQTGLDQQQLSVLGKALNVNMTVHDAFAEALHVVVTPPEPPGELATQAMNGILGAFVEMGASRDFVKEAIARWEGSTLPNRNELVLGELTEWRERLYPVKDEALEELQALLEQKSVEEAISAWSQKYI